MARTDQGTGEPRPDQVFSAPRAKCPPPRKKSAQPPGAEGSKRPECLVLKQILCGAPRLQPAQREPAAPRRHRRPPQRHARSSPAQSANLRDCQLARPSACETARLRDCQLARLPACETARLRDCPLARLPVAVDGEGRSTGGRTAGAKRRGRSSRPRGDHLMLILRAYLKMQSEPIGSGVQNVEVDTCT